MSSVLNALQRREGFSRILSLGPSTRLRLRRPNSAADNNVNAELHGRGTATPQKNVGTIAKKCDG